MNLRPLGDRILVKRIEAEAVSQGGIIIPDTAQDKPMMGDVIAVGEGKLLAGGQVRKLDVKAGDRVMFKNKWAGTEFELDGSKLVMLDSDDVMGVVE